jgi:hypothetical protein
MMALSIGSTVSMGVGAMLAGFVSGPIGAVLFLVGALAIGLLRLV